MPSIDRAAERRAEFVPVLAETFAELGFRRATTAELARRCGVQETILYRLWPDKKAMFIAAIEWVYDLSTRTWEDLLAGGAAKKSAAERLLDYEATHHGEFGLYRIVFAGLTEADDPEIREALRRMYSRYQAFIARRVREHRDRKGTEELSAWAIIGLGTVSSIGRELGLLGEQQRQQLWKKVGRQLLEGPQK
ncbi:MAG: TetR/AcrR family transcriptional regulator [Planctomycetota bacterium]|jgi:AcrR family transcriptional regulator